MGEKIRKTISLLVFIGFNVLAFDVGVNKLFLGPLLATLTLYHAGTLTLHVFLKNLVRMILSATVAGGIWCIGYIVSSRFYSRPVQEDILEMEQKRLLEQRREERKRQLMEEHTAVAGGTTDEKC